MFAWQWTAIGQTGRNGPTVRRRVARECRHGQGPVIVLSLIMEVSCAMDRKEKQCHALHASTAQVLKTNHVIIWLSVVSISSVELFLLLAPPLGINSLLHSACYLRTTCILSASFLRHFSLTVAGLRAPLSRFLEGALYKYPPFFRYFHIQQKWNAIGCRRFLHDRR